MLRFANILLVYILLTPPLWAQVTMTIGELRGMVGQEFSIPVNVTGLPASGVTQFNLQFSYDSKLIYIAGIEQSGTLTSSSSLQSDPFAGGQKRIRVTRSSGSSISQNGVLFRLHGRIVGTGSNAQGISLSSFIVNNGAVTVSSNLASITASPGTPPIISIPAQISTIGSTIDIPVNVNGISTSHGAYSISMTFGYNPNVLEYVSLITAGTLSANRFPQTNNAVPGRLGISIVGVSPYNGTGDLFRIRMRVKPNAPSNSTLRFENFLFDNDSPSVVVQDGTLRVTNGTSVALEDEELLPHTMALDEAYPNPFNPTTTIPFHLSETTHIVLSIIDTTGRQVKVLARGAYSAGSHRITFDAENLPSGVYLVRLEAGTQVDTRKITLIK